MPVQIKKRDGRTTKFNSDKIYEAINKASQEVSSTPIEEAVLRGVVDSIVAKCKEEETVESVQDYVEEALMEAGLYDVAKAYILYRQKRTDAREGKSVLMNKIRAFHTEDEGDPESTAKENANVNAKSVSGSFYRCGSEANKEFNKTDVIPKKFVEAFERGDIYYHDRDYYDLSINCMQHDLLKMFKKGFSTGNAFITDPKRIESATALTAVILLSGQTDLFGGESVPAWDFYMEPYVEKTFQERFRTYLQRFDFSSENQDKLCREYRYQEHTPVIESDNIYRCYSWAKKDTEEKVYQSVQALVFNLNSLASRAGGQVVFSSLNFGTCTKPGGRLVIRALLKALDEGIGHGITALYPISIFKLKAGINYNPGDPNYDLFMRAIEVTAKRQFPNYSNLDAPYNLQYYKEGHPETEVAYMGCRTRVLGNVNGPEIVTDRGNLSFTTLNLPRYAIKAKLEHEKEGTDILDAFYKYLDEAMDLAREQLWHRFRVQCNRRVYNFPYVMQQGAYMGSEYLQENDKITKALYNGTLSFGFVGLAECLTALTGHDHADGEEYQKLGLDIIRKIRSYLDYYTEETHMNWSLIATPAESVAGTLLRKDKAEFGIIPGVTDKDYYTNSNHIPVGKKLKASEKIKLEAPYHALCNAGHILYIEVEGDPTQNLEALQALIRLMHDSGAGYFSFNSKMDCHTSCGYVGIIDDVCPGCGQKESATGRFIRPRRVTGYLSYLDRFNASKEAEAKDRVTHV